MELGETIFEKHIFSWPHIQCCQIENLSQKSGAEMVIFVLSVSIVTFFENILVYNWPMYGAITVKVKQNLYSSNTDATLIK